MVKRGGGGGQGGREGGVRGFRTKGRWGVEGGGYEGGGQFNHGKKEQGG